MPKPYYINPSGYDTRLLKDAETGRPLRRDGRNLYRAWLLKHAPLTLVDRYGRQNRCNWDIKITDFNSFPWFVRFVGFFFRGSDPVADPQPAIMHDDEFLNHARFIHDPVANLDCLVPSSMHGANERYEDGTVAVGKPIRAKIRFRALEIGGGPAWRGQYNPELRRKYGIPDDAIGD